MDNNQIFLGQTAINFDIKDVNGEFVIKDNDKYYKISNYNQMPDFFMTIVSDANHWMFLSSNGSLSAGRKDRDNALFPYYTVDKIHDYCGKTGSFTIFRVELNNKLYLWKPFNKELANIYNIERNIYKNEFGNKVIFEEINNDFGLSFEYCWTTSDSFGIVKKSSIKKLSEQVTKIDVLDGIRNIMPSGIDYAFQTEYSNLLDSYKKNELIEDTNIALFFLSSIPVDKAEPSESLTTTTVFSQGIDNPTILISDNQIANFQKGLALNKEYDIRASRGAYYVSTTFDFKKDTSYSWIFAADINQRASDVAKLNSLLKNNSSIIDIINDDIDRGEINLVKKVAGADGLQLSNEELCSASHFSKTMFNILRGGTYLKGYKIDLNDFKEYINNTNKILSINFESFINGLKTKITITELLLEANKLNDFDFIRLCYEYLPLSFSRRHGDPSRPWNKFSIDNKNPDGSDKLDYQGNWRDIFQNWEALSLSYPEFIENIICKFVNATTADGYNPYRIMRNGIDWECPDPDDPWAYIGYWGDHQIIYLQKLLELSNKYHPGKLKEFLSKDIFTYANVPYRIKSYEDIKKNPNDTIDFDFQLNNKIINLVDEIGSDAKLILDNENCVYYVNFTEKILTTLLSKLSNFIPDAGIWLNTQRPEWNDANNALVGNGVSMVTLYYLRRFLKFWNNIFSNIEVADFKISSSLKTLFDSEFNVFKDYKNNLYTGFTDEVRLDFIDSLGKAGGVYRESVYDKSFIEDKSKINSLEIVKFTHIALEYIDKSIKSNKRYDGLYHSYNIISFDKDALSVHYLYEMLEGQVAVLSSGYLSAIESLEVLKALRKSKLFREDQNSYLLYPNRELTKFVDKNNINKALFQKSKLLNELIKVNDTSVINIDVNGNYHFNESFRNAEILEKTLNTLDNHKNLVKEEKSLILRIYEEVFNHNSFTGRSGTFYGYEGLGSIYWHMVSKLLLAVEENYFTAIEQQTDIVILDELKEYYYEIKDGIGLFKSPKLYGAFPFDPYSHTPANAGVKQPGMTGQVKEDVIARMGELGIIVNNGEITFDTSLLDKKEFLTKEMIFSYITLNGEKEEIALSNGQLGFTLCQIPIIYSLNKNNKVKINYIDGKNILINSNIIDANISSKIFNRTNEIYSIEVDV